MLIHRKIVWHFNLLSVDDICTCHGPWWGWPEFKIAPIHAMSVEVVVYCLLYRHGALWLQWQKFLSYNQKYKILMFFIKKTMLLHYYYLGQRILIFILWHMLVRSDYFLAPLGLNFFVYYWSTNIIMILESTLFIYDFFYWKISAMSTSKVISGIFKI